MIVQTAPLPNGGGENLISQIAEFRFILLAEVNMNPGSDYIPRSGSMRLPAAVAVLMLAAGLPCVAGSAGQRPDYVSTALPQPPEPPPPPPAVFQHAIP